MGAGPGRPEVGGADLAVRAGPLEEGAAMRYELMRPGQIRGAIERRWPLLIPVGVIEYHGLHNPVGVDALIVQGLAHELDRRVECVVAPTIFYGYTGEWAGDERLGEIHVDGEGLYRFAKPILKAFFKQGWRRIYVICHHQGPWGVTHLSYQRAATESAMEVAREEHGAEWWRTSRDGLDPRWFETFHVVTDAEYAAGAGYGGHGGRDETSAMLHFHPDTVDLKELGRMDPLPFWAADAGAASAAHGRAVAERLLEAWAARLRRDQEG
jgi:creatinine amidohydrolase/Fe(II)-dependent formamide hydrolase-like protein